jgi:GTP-binding protein
MGLFSKAQFLTTVNHLRDLPPHGGKEVAFAGRSNAGKSSAINTLANHTRLAFTSKTPGRTQHINYFSLGEGKFLVDLPGYGYAKVPLEVRAHWEGLLSQYLQTREDLCGLVVIMDARHPLTDLDEQMLDWFAPTGKPVHVLLTKSDKLSRQQAALTLNRVTCRLAERFSSDITPASGHESSPKHCFPHCTAQLFSSLKKTGADEAEAVIGKWLGAGEQKKAPG